MRTSLSLRFARGLIRWYPAPWRERYQAEVLSLLGETPVGPADLIDLLRRLVIERARSLVEPAARPQLTAAVLQVLRVFPLLALALVPGAIALTLAARVGEPAAWLAWLTFPGLIGALGARVVRMRRVARGGRNLFEAPLFDGRAGWLYLSAMFIGTAWILWLHHGDPTPSSLGQGFGFFHDLMWIYWMGVALHDQWTSGRSFGAPIIRAAAELNVTGRLKWATMELERCKSLAVRGQIAPLDAAQAEVDRLKAQKACALATLRRLGYRARFRRS